MLFDFVIFIWLDIKRLQKKIVRIMFGSGCRAHCKPFFSSKFFGLYLVFRYERYFSFFKTAPKVFTLRQGASSHGRFSKEVQRFRALVPEVDKKVIL